MKVPRRIPLLTLLLLAGNLGLAAQECATFQAASPNELVSYLGKVSRPPANDSCTAFAIKNLGEQRHEAAIPVLTKSLELRWPPDARQKQRRYVLEHDGASIYPAATALERIGKNALPAVLDAMKSSFTSREAMEVAVSVWMTIYKDQAPLAVALLKQEADRTKDPLVRQRLGWAAYQAARGWCSPTEKSQCVAAAQTRY